MRSTVPKSRRKSTREQPTLFALQCGFDSVEFYSLNQPITNEQPTNNQRTTNLLYLKTNRQNIKQTNRACAREGCFCTNLLFFVYFPTETQTQFFAVVDKIGYCCELKGARTVGCYRGLTAVRKVEKTRRLAEPTTNNYSLKTIRRAVSNAAKKSFVFTICS